VHIDIGSNDVAVMLSILNRWIGIVRPSDEYIAAKTASEFLTEDRILEDLALEERLDATMDKAIRRLAQAKALKQTSGLNRRGRDKPAVLQIDWDKEKD
jgi:hypothetical protein